MAKTTIGAVVSPLALAVMSSPVSSGLPLSFLRPSSTTTWAARSTQLPRWTVRRSGGGSRPAASLHALLHAASSATPVDDPLQAELDGEGLGLCHGMLHASGVRRLADLRGLTNAQITGMGADALDRRNLLRVVDKLNQQKQEDSSPDGVLPIARRELSTRIDGAFANKADDDDEDDEDGDNDNHQPDFDLEVICAERGVFRGRLFTAPQCEQINRMAEYHAYRETWTVGAGWTDEMYALTDRHMRCRDVPGLVAAVAPLFDRLLRELPDAAALSARRRIRPGCLRLERDEPHLVRYSGRCRGTRSHTDSGPGRAVGITVIAALSAEGDDYTGGGTHITELNRTVSLRQGEMLVHPGDLEHAGVDITSGVRRILVAFVACEWEDEE